MSSSSSFGVFTAQQRCLLKAALLPPTEARFYWQTFIDTLQLSRFSPTDKTLLARLFDPLTEGMQRLMPLVYRNLEATDAPLVPVLRGYYRFTWMKNQQLFAHTAEALRVLHRAGVDTMLIKGLPMALTYYGDLGTRPINDIDILVPDAQLKTATQALLRSSECMATDMLAHKYHDLHYAAHFVNNHEFNLDLHWHLLSFHTYPGADNSLWAARQSITLPDGTTSTAPAPAHLLFHAIVHGFNMGHGQVLRWLPDSYRLIRQAGAALDWPLLLDTADHYRLHLPVQTALRVLHDDFNVALPSDVLRYVATPRPPGHAEAYFAMVTQPRAGGRLRRWQRFVRRNYLYYRAFVAGRAATSFPAFLARRVRYYTEKKRLGMGRPPQLHG